MGPRAKQKKYLIKLGKLGKYGKPTNETPISWLAYYLSE